MQLLLPDCSHCQVRLNHALENFWSLNLLLVDNEHIIIGFPTKAKDRGTRFGIRISNKAIIESVIRWYDEYLWREAVPVHWTGE